MSKMIEPIKVSPSLDQLGLPPMELAESADERQSRFLYRCIYPTLQKIFILMFIIVFSAGTYLMLLKVIENTDTSRNTEIIVIAGSKDSPNITLSQKEMNIFFQFNNITTNPKNRSKRNILDTEKNAFLSHLKESDLQRVTEIILQHRTLCHEKQHEQVCQELIRKIKSIIHKEDVQPINTESLNKSEAKRNDEPDIALVTDIRKREAQSIADMRGVLSKGLAPALPLDVHHVAPRGHMGPVQLTDTCLLAKLLKQNYPHIHGIYDSSAPEFMESHIDQTPTADIRYYQQPMNSYIQNREMEQQKPKLHSQDVDIFMGFLTQNSEAVTNKANSTLQTRNIECPPGTLPCVSSEDCIDVKERCDGNVDCADASDEVECSCKSRIDSSRLCDGYFDCPFGEDEMGCFGCSENTFSCDNVNMQSQSTCFTKEQRCNGVGDCPNHKDEIECNMLAPSLFKKPLFAISNTEGYLHRNFKGDWYAVCQNPYMWAHDACRRETGLIIRPPFIQIVPIDPLMKVSYLNTGPGGSIQLSDTCFNSSAVYVTCPDFLCGSRVSTNTQLLRENIAQENLLFGRNKRFLYSDHPYDPYRMIYYGSRMKRDTADTDKTVQDSRKTIDDDDERNKRESRVVGGKPSQPAAWPWTVAIYRNGMFHCGGVVLTQRWIISAAHCVHKFWDHYYEIQVGMLRRFSFSPQEQNHRVTHVIVNQHYSQMDMKDDLSLLRVERAIQFSRWVRPICLPGPNTAGADWMWGPPPGTMCTAVGWGATMEHGPDPDHMREVEVPIWEICKHREDRDGREICAGLAEGGKDACQGDSGGPLLCRNPLNSQQWYLAGIVSHGDGCARKDEPGVYTRVSLFVKWIKYHISSKSLPLVQPIQECPGFKCKSGISKCLPHNRKCDRIVDCLDAEDELNCNYKDMRSVSRPFPEKKNITSENTTSEKRETIVSTASDNFLHPVDNTVITEQATAISIMTTTEITTTTNNNESDNQPEESTLRTTISDFERATTPEIDSSTSSEESQSESTESVTADPNSTSTEIDETRGDLQKFTMSFTPETLESRSSSLGNNEKQDDKFRKADIHINWFTDSTTALIETMGKIEQTNLQKITPTIDDSMLDNSITEATSTKLDKPKTKSEEFLLELLPNTKINSSKINDSQEFIGSNLNNQDSIGSNSDNLSSKNLPDLESKSGTLNEIEDIALSEFQPANIRRKHRVPVQFECRRIYQMISYNQRCDHKADCEDGTDELDCTCTDYLLTYDDKLLCDGVFDCSDGQDEIDCYACPEEHFLCKKSEICLPMKYVCDGIPQCPLGEDELNCYALSNGKEIFYDIDDKPRIHLEGYITKRNGDDWHVICEDNLSVDQQEQSANHICRYLGFSAANKYSVKYINVKDEDIVRSKLEDKRIRRNSNGGKSIHFAYRKTIDSNETARNIVIKEPQLLKEECVPNVTKTCKSLYVYCDRSLYSNFDFSQNLIYTRAVENHDISTDLWPWVAKVFVEGYYKCTGILVEMSWVLVNSNCLWDYSSTSNVITVILGSHRTLNTVGAFEKVHKVDTKKELYRSRVILLHLKVPVEYTNKVKPMIFSGSLFNSDKDSTCLAIGEDGNNKTIGIFLNETTKNCNLSNRCFIRQEKEKICPVGMKLDRQWAGLISCHNEQGWYPVASFVDSRGECNIGDTIVATDIENLRREIKHYAGKQLHTSSFEHMYEDACEGVRCSRGRCVSLKEMCDGVSNCEDGNDESDDSCKKKLNICEHDAYYKGCECSLGQMKCRNGRCVSKELFRDGNDDCGDGTDEPLRTSCSDYLARVMPSRLCDGILHCQDRSDEDPMYCKCFAKRTFSCGLKSSETEHCVAPDMVCDGVFDCPNGEDERTCVGLSAPEGTPHGVGQVMVQSHGVWRSKCYPTQNHTRTELEAICRELGFLSGHAKEIKEMKNNVSKNTPNILVLEHFSELPLQRDYHHRSFLTDPAVVEGLLKAIQEAVYDRHRGDDVMLPPFDPDKNDSGADSWCSTISSLALDLG